MKPIAVVTFVISLGIAIGFSIYGITRAMPPAPLHIITPAEQIQTSGANAPTLYFVCWKNLGFMSRGQSTGGLVQIFQADGKPFECDK